MKKVLLTVLVAAGAGVCPVEAQTFSGRLSDSMCGASHSAKAAAGSLSERQCIFECVKALATFVLVDENKQVIPIANPDAAGLPLYAGRLVRITGERKRDAIFVSKVEAIPAHLHLGHVVTNWRDTPGTRGFLPVAVDEARTAVMHARLASSAADLDGIKLHAAHVVHALDPSAEPKGPGAGYGVKRAATGALQHLELAIKSEGASASVHTHAAHISAPLKGVIERTDQALAVAQKIRAATDASEAAKLAGELSALMGEIAEKDLHQAQAHMELMLKAEGIFGAPR